MADPRVLVAGLLLVDSLYYIFARLLLPLVPPAAGAMYMLVLGALQIAVLLRGRIDWGVLWRHRWLFLTVGLLVGVNTNMGFVAVKYVDPGTASLLSRTSIIFGVGLGVGWLGERLDRRELIGALVAVAGVLTISFQPGDYLRWGALIVVASTALYAIHSAAVKRFGGEIPFGDFMFFRVASVAAVLTVLAGAQGALGVAVPGGVGVAVRGRRRERGLQPGGLLPRAAPDGHEPAHDHPDPHPGGDVGLVHHAVRRAPERDRDRRRHRDAGRRPDRHREPGRAARRDAARSRRVLTAAIAGRGSARRPYT